MIEPFSAGAGIEAALKAISVCVKTAKLAQDLLHAVRGAKHKKSVWYALCEELSSNCEILLPLIQNVTTELQQGKQSAQTNGAVEDLMEVLYSALEEGKKLVETCQTSSTTSLFFRGESMKEKFRKVAGRMAECLRNIPLAAFSSTLSIQNDVNFIVQQLEKSRFELSEEDRALFRDVHEVVGNQGVQSMEQHTATLSLMKQMEERLNMKVGDMRQEMKANLGDAAVDLDAKEQKFMSQIMTLLVQTANGGSGNISSSGDIDAGSNKALRKPRSGPPKHLTCPITFELMQDPVIDAFGHTFERRAITKALLYKQGISPTTNDPYPNGEAKLRTNYSVRDAIEEYLEEQSIEVVAMDEIEPAPVNAPVDQDDVFSLSSSKVHTADQKLAQPSTSLSAPSSHESPPAHTRVNINSVVPVQTTSGFQSPPAHTSGSFGEEDQPPHMSIGFLIRFKWWILLGALLLVAAVIAGVVAGSAGGSSGGGDDIIVLSPPPSPKSPPPSPQFEGSADDVPVICDVRFTGLNINEFNDQTFSDTFNDEFRTSLAAAAGVSIGRVNIGAITAGSVVVSSVVRFPRHMLSESEVFSATLASNPAGAFVSSTMLLSFAPIEVVVYAPPPPPPSPPPPRPPPSPPSPPPPRPPPSPPSPPPPRPPPSPPSPPPPSPPPPRPPPSPPSPPPPSLPPGAFTHPCTGATLSSATTTTVRFDSSCPATTIPTQLGQLTGLTYLSFSSASSLTGTIPTQLGQLTGLTVLYFTSASSLTGTIPTRLGQLTGLRLLDFSYASSLTGTIPTQLGQLTGLTYLFFYSASSLTGTIPTRLGQLTGLIELSFYRASSLTGTIPTQLGQLTGLTVLDFRFASSLTGTIPMEIRRLTALTYCGDQQGTNQCS